MAKALKARPKTVKSTPARKDDRAALDALLGEAVFDWFQFTLPAVGGGAMTQIGGPEERRAIASVLEWADQAGLHPGKTRGGANGYRVGLPLLAGPEGETVAVLSSGSIIGIMPNLCITGGQGEGAELAVLAQRAFPGARLSRADVALDRAAPGLWSALLGMAKRLAAGNEKLGDVRVIESAAGRTFYLGSPSSTVSLRVYEKGKERAAKDAPGDRNPDLVRIEWTFRPQSRSKAGMAKLTPAQMIRSSVWARDFMSRAAVVLGDAERPVKLDRQAVEREERVTSLEGSAWHGARQYGGTFARLAVAKLVEERHDGDYAAAALSPVDVQERAALIWHDMIRETGVVFRVIESEGVAVEETRDERRDRIAAGMIRGAIAVTQGRADAVGVVGDGLRVAGHVTAAAAAAAAQAGLLAVVQRERAA